MKKIQCNEFIIVKDKYYKHFTRFVTEILHGLLYHFVTAKRYIRVVVINDFCTFIAIEMSVDSYTSVYYDNINGVKYK
jgi:hypothetical protein